VPESDLAETAEREIVCDYCQQVFLGEVLNARN
jgi:hypothetical protein